MSNLLTDIKGISADDILPLASEDKETEPTVSKVGSISVEPMLCKVGTSAEVMEV